MSDLDEISRVLGRMEGVLDNVGAQCNALVSSVAKVSEEVIEHRGVMKLLASTQAEMQSDHDSLSDYVKPPIEDYKAMKNKGIGAVFGVSLVSGGFGAGLATLLGRLFGNGPGPHSP